KIPEVIDRYSRARVLTEERVAGRNISSLAEPLPRATTARRPEGRKAATVERRTAGKGARKGVEKGVGLSRAHQTAVSQRIARFVLEPAFERGVFYADPHPGNLLIQDDGTLAVVDFGKVGRLTPDVRRRVAEMFVAIARGDAQRLTDRLVEV